MSELTGSFRRKASYLLEQARKAYPAPIDPAKACAERNIGRPLRVALVRWLVGEGHLTIKRGGSVKAAAPPAGTTRTDWERPRF